jgi:U2-associated protein SR140
VAYVPISVSIRLMIARGIDLEHANRRGQTGLTGFVAFMKRAAAEKAVNELDNLNWGGSVIRVAFGNAVRVPARPIYGKSYTPGTY